MPTSTEMTLRKDTKRTVVYEAVSEFGASVTQLYIQKHSLPTPPYPLNITVTVSWEEKA